MSDREAERRVVSAVGDDRLVETLAGLSGSDLTTLLLAVMRTRAARVNPSDVLRGYASGRFVVPAQTPFEALRRAEDAFLSACGEAWEKVELSPLLPFGTHASMGQLSQDRVVSTIRSSEAAADPTNGLSLEAAARRRASRGEPIRLATVQRIVRAQRFDEGAPSHFTLFALVTAGRDTGSDRFEMAALVDHLSVHVAGIRKAGGRAIRVLLTDLADESPDFAEGVSEQFQSADDVAVELDPQRTGGRMYYRRACFKVRADFGGGEIEVSDGGFTDWTAVLLQDRKERLCISGSGLDNVAATSPPQ
jgi:hypothetical protein